MKKLLFAALAVAVIGRGFVRADDLDTKIKEAMQGANDMITKIKVAVVGLLTTMGVFAHETWREPSTGIEWNYSIAEDDNGILSAVVGTEQGDPAIPKSTYGAIVIPSMINGFN